MSMRTRMWLTILVLLSVVLPTSFVTRDARAAEPRVIVRSDFEDGSTQGWGRRGDGVVVAPTTEASHSGTYSLKTTGRTASWHGPSLNVTANLQQGVTYAIEGYVRLVAGQQPSDFKITVQRDSGGTTAYDQVVASPAGGVTDAAWVRLAGEYSFATDASALQLYVESSDATSQYYLDDLTITQLSGGSDGQPLPGTSSDFEDNTTQGWVPRGGSVAVTNADKHGGSYSLLTTGRTQSWQGPSLNILNKVTKGAKYHVSVWVKLAPGEAASALRVSVQREYQGTTNWDTVVGNTSVTADQWVNLTADYTLTNTVDSLSIYVESATSLASFYIDDFTLTHVQLPPIQTDIPSVYQTLAPYFPVGAAIEPSQLDSSRHVELLQRHFNSLVAENVMKPGPIQPVEGQFNWAEADKLVQFARNHNLEMRGHTLVWHNQNPSWLFRDATGAPMTATPENKALLLQRLDAHIRAVVGRYKDDIQAWDVVNEVIDPSQPGGMRSSEWYKITGVDYISTAFRVAREVAPNAKLYINDYSTTDPAKRQFLYDLVRDLTAQGVPIDGVGHQMHVNIQSPSAAAIEQTIQLFAGLGLDNQITEFDMSVYANDTDTYTTVPQDILVKQGYRYKEVFDAFKRQRAHISSVTLWGLADDHTWLKTFPITRLDLPLLFDERQQAKPAYWGVVDPSKLPVLIQQRDIPRGKPQIDGKSELAWDMLPAVALESTSDTAATFKTLWDQGILYVIADVQDATPDKADRVEVFIDDNNGKTAAYQLDDARYSFLRDGPAPSGTTVSIKKTETSYRVEVAIPLKTAATEGRQIGFDIRVTNVSQPNAPISWNDLTHNQDTNTANWSTLTLVGPTKLTSAVRGTPTIDGVADAVWASAREITTNTWVQGTSGAQATVKTLWDAGHLYVFAIVTDARLSKASANPWEQDSLEIFVDQNNAKTLTYQPDDSQYRVNFDNEQSYGGSASANTFVTATKIVSGGYVVEARIKLEAVQPQANGFIGFDVQVNDDAAGTGTRSSVAIWSDPSGQSYQNTSKLGVLQFAKK